MNAYFICSCDAEVQYLLSCFLDKSDYHGDYIETWMLLTLLGNFSTLSILFCPCSHTCRCLSSLVKCGASTKHSPPCRKCPCRCQSNSLSSCPPRTQWNSLNTQWACSPLSPAWTRRWSFQRSKCRISTGSHLTIWLERAGAEWGTGWANVSLEFSVPTRRTCPEALHMKLAFFVLSVYTAVVCYKCMFKKWMSSLI